MGVHQTLLDSYISQYERDAFIRDPYPTLVHPAKLQKGATPYLEYDGKALSHGAYMAVAQRECDLIAADTSSHHLNDERLRDVQINEVGHKYLDSTGSEHKRTHESSNPAASITKLLIDPSIRGSERDQCG